MMKLRYVVLTALVAFASIACETPAVNTSNGNSNTVGNAGSNANAGNTTASAPSKETILTMEKQAWEAWKNADSKFFADFLSDRWIGFGPNGREDKAANIKRLTDAKCEVKSYSISEDQLHMLGKDVAVLSFKADQDAVCAGTKAPSPVWVTSAYAREGDKWKALSYMETAYIDPSAPAAKPSAPAAAPTAKTETETKPDAMAETLMAVENRAWESWKTRDAKAMEALMAPNFTYVGSSGRYDRAGSLKTWSEPKCEGLAYTLSEPRALSISPDVALVTYKADLKGSCDGKPATPAVWVASFNTKEGDTWKNAHYMDMPR
jgi:ketosteroid isomerase-like protein